MLRKLGHRIQEERGFALIELLVVVLIIGVLAAIAIPTFLNQRAKAYDAGAKSDIVNAQTAMETYANNNNGSYPASGSTSSASDPLVSIVPQLNNQPYVSYTSSGSSYTLTSTSVGSIPDTFVLTDNAGVVTRTCTGTGGGCSGTTW